MRNYLISVFILTSLISFGQETTIEDLWKLYNSHNFKSVIEKAQPLLERDPNNVDINSIIGRSLTDLSDFKNAIPYLELSVKNDTNNSWQKAWALGYLGTCYFMLQDYDNSKNTTKECFNLNVTKNATQYAYRGILLFGFDDFYNDWKIVESDNFRFHFQDMSDSDIKSYVSTREEAFQSINKFFNSKLPKKIDYFVWESREDAKNLLKANLGFSDPGFCIVHCHYQQTVGHEMTHIISNYTSEIKTKTRFINEGTAVCFDLSNKDNLIIAKEWISVNNKLISIKDFWANGDKYGEEILYPISGLFVRELLDNFGKEKFLEFFKNQTYENAKLVFGNNIDKLIEDIEKKINT